jgi:hypothetical protein
MAGGRNRARFDITRAIDEFMNTADLAGAQGRFNSAADLLTQQATGDDPMLNMLQQIALGEQDPFLDFEENRALGGVQEQFSRRGLGFSAAAQNAANRTRQSFGTQRLGRRDAAIGQVQSREAFRAALLDQALQAASGGVEIAAMPAEMEIAKHAAIVGDDSSGGGGCSFFCMILTDALLQAGLLATTLFAANAVYAASRQDVETYRGYRLWATPLRRLMGFSPLVRRIVAAGVTRYCEQAAHRIGAAGGRDTLSGRILLRGLPAFSRCVARLLPQRAARVSLCPIYRR